VSVRSEKELTTSMYRTALAFGEAGTSALGGKNFFSNLSSEQILSFSDCFFSARALQISQGYWPLKVMLTACVKGTICE